MIRAKLIKFLREKRGFSEDFIAEQLGITRNWYFELESIDDEISDTVDILQVVQLGALLGVSPRELLREGGEGVPTDIISFEQLILRSREC